MANWIDFLKSMKTHFLADRYDADADPPKGSLPADTVVLVGVDSQIPKYPAIRLSLRREERLDRLKRSDIHEKRTATFYVEAWTAGGSPDGAVTLEALADFEDLVISSLGTWAVSPADLSGVTFAATVTEIQPGSDQSRPAVGSRITVKVDYL